MTNLQQRLLVGVLGAAFIISGICFNQWSYILVIFGISIFSLMEFHSLVNSAGISTNKFTGVLLGLVLVLGSFLVEAGYFKNAFYLFFYALGFVLFFIELFQTNEKPFERTAFSFLAIVYTALPYALLNHIVF
ncbi:MAG TPA: phosphatidate cytidylyltransferase, partial [Cytophagaceae bacterium]|nr:phosphatidate cytidylyltransferase [Cytophagaceae bacterium]